MMNSRLTSIIGTDRDFATFQKFGILANDVFLEHKEGPNTDRVIKIISAFDEVVADAPAFDLGQYWAYPELAAAIAMSKRTASIWDAVSGETKEKLSLIMELCLYLGAYATQRNNNYHTGFLWRGNFSKKWNPNVQLSVYPLMVYAIDYIGNMDTVNDMLVNFNFDELMIRIQDNGFSRCYECWNTTPCELSEGVLAPTAKDLLENGGTAYIKDDFGNLLFGGHGESIKQPYKQWNGGVWYLPKQVISDCFKGGVCSSSIDVDGDGTFDGYILDKTTSPAEGLEGMYTEFNTTQGTTATIRSSLHYCLVDFILVNTLIAYVEEIDWLKLSWDAELQGRVIVGNTDLIYKAEHGYHGMNLTAKQVIDADIISEYYPAFEPWKDYWNNYLNG